VKLDIRTPIGLFFTTVGAILAAYGLVSDPAIYAAHSFGLNVNLGWGLTVAAFGVLMLALSRVGREDR
jgi:hypothetical protein